MVTSSIVSLPIGARLNSIRAGCACVQQCSCNAAKSPNRSTYAKRSAKLSLGSLPCSERENCGPVRLLLFLCDSEQFHRRLLLLAVNSPHSFPWNMVLFCLACPLGGGGGHSKSIPIRRFSLSSYYRNLSAEKSLLRRRFER